MNILQGKGVEEAFRLLCEEILERLEVSRGREEEVEDRAVCT